MIVISIAYVLLFCIGIAGGLLYPKTSYRLNGVKMLVMGVMAIFCYQVFMAQIIKLCGVRVDIKSTCFSMLIMDIALWLRIISKKKVQKLFWRLSDIISIIAIISIVCAISIHLFTTDILLRYKNIDAASHFSFAMNIVQSGEIYNIYFSAFIDAMFIELFAPVLATVQYYKAFILADIFMHILEICMFYVLAITISDRKSVRIAAPVFSVAYFLGYPAYSYMTGNFVYWSNGVMILMFIIYSLLLWEKRPELKKYAVILLALGTYANCCCNKLFVVINSGAVLVTVLILLLSKGKVIRKRIFLIGVVIVGIVAVVGGVWYVQLWGDSLKDIINLLLGNGGIYRSMYADLIFLLPACFLVVYYVCMKKYQLKTICTMSLYMVLCTVAMYVLWYNYLLSTYYYYKIYYNLWLLGWLLCVVALDIMDGEGQLPAAVAYGGMIVVIGVITFSDYDAKMLEYNEQYNASYATSELFPLYRLNANDLSEDYEKYRMSDLILDVFNYAIEECEEEYVPIVVSDLTTKMWYDSLKGVDSTYYNIDERALPDILTSLSANGVEKILVVKDESYVCYKDYFDRCVPIYENDDAAIYTFPGVSFADLWSMELANDIGKEQIFGYIRDYMPNEDVPLVAAKSSYLDFIMYYNYMGKSACEYYMPNDELQECLDKLNKNNVEYIAVLYGDEYYQGNQAYFDNQEIVYENESGKIIKCIEGKW